MWVIKYTESANGGMVEWYRVNDLATAYSHCQPVDQTFWHIKMLPAVRTELANNSLCLVAYNEHDPNDMGRLWYIQDTINEPNLVPQRPPAHH